MKKTAIPAALCVILCAAMLAPLIASCGRKRQVVPRATTERTETADTANGGTDADSGDADRDADHVIVIDPGHGFGDTGLTSPYTERSEAEIALAFSRKLYAELTDRGYTVFLTHDGSSIPETKKDNGDGSFDDRERASFADEREAEYFISVHCNTYADDGAEDVRGSRVYVSAAAKAGKNAVTRAGEELCSALDGTPEGEDSFSLIVTPKNDSYNITTLADGVSLLLKLGYMSNPRDARLMTDRNWIARTAEHTADAVDAYFKEG